MLSLALGSACLAIGYMIRAANNYAWSFLVSPDTDTPSNANHIA